MSRTQTTIVVVLSLAIGYVAGYFNHLVIMRANNLESTLIHPGDHLLVPYGEFTITIDLPNELVVVHHGDGFFKQYSIKAIDLPPSNQSRLATKVIATVFRKDGELISPSALGLRRLPCGSIWTTPAISFMASPRRTESKERLLKFPSIRRRTITLLRSPVRHRMRISRPWYRPPQGRHERTAMLLRRGTAVTIIRE